MVWVRVGRIFVSFILNNFAQGVVIPLSHMYRINNIARECLAGYCLAAVSGQSFATSILNHKLRAYGHSVSYMAVVNFNQLLNPSMYYTTKIQQRSKFIATNSGTPMILPSKFRHFSQISKNFVGPNLQRSRVMWSGVRCFSKVSRSTQLSYSHWPIGEKRGPFKKRIYNLREVSPAEELCPIAGFMTIKHSVNRQVPATLQYIEFR